MNNYNGGMRGCCQRSCIIARDYVSLTIISRMQELLVCRNATRSLGPSATAFSPLTTS